MKNVKFSFSTHISISKENQPAAFIFSQELAISAIPRVQPLNYSNFAVNGHKIAEILENAIFDQDLEFFAEKSF